MIWKIENIKDNDLPIDKKIIKNCRAMIASLEPDRGISQPRIYEVSKLVDRTERLQRQGQYRSARAELREAYRILDEMDCKRKSGASTFQTVKENKSSWTDNHLKKSLSEILRKH